jgi:hypothetical protein
VREDEQVLLDGERHVEVVELRDDAHLARAPLRVLGQACSRAPRARPRRRSPAPSAAASSSTCRAVGARGADARALGHVELQVVHSRDLAEALHNAA